MTRKYSSYNKSPDDLPAGTIVTEEPEPKCFHVGTLIPLEFICAKRGFDQEFGYKYDWGSNVINAHLIRISKYYCSNCQEVIKIPLILKGEKGDSNDQ